MGKEYGVHQLNDKQFAQWKNGERITGPIGGGCLMAMVALPFTALWALLRKL